MSVPLHGIDCTTLTFPTNCSNCGERVFFFSCSCGSRVFFDALGAPWPVHDCGFTRSDKQWAQSRKKTKLENGAVRVEISNGITAIRPGETQDRDWNIDPSVEEKARREERSRELNPIESIPPGEKWEIKVTGIIREIVQSVNVYKKLNMPETEVSSAFLGQLGTDKWGRLTIHELKSVIHSYTIWVRTSKLSSSSLKKGIAVSAVLRRCDVLMKAREWVCEDICIE